MYYGPHNLHKGRGGEKIYECMMSKHYTAAFKAKVVQELSAEEIAIKQRIDELYTAYPFYRSRRMVAQLQREGREVNRSHGFFSDLDDTYEPICAEPTSGVVSRYLTGVLREPSARRVASGESRMMRTLRSLHSHRGGFASPKKRILPTGHARG
jgi:hypothetical protein